jgi:hypothetical protein
MELIKDGLMFKGVAITRYKNPITGEYIPGSEQINENMVVDTGAVEIVKWLANSSPASAGAFQYMALGSGVTAAAHGQTSLVTEYTGVGTYARISGTQSVQAEGAYGNKVYQVLAEFPACTGCSAAGEIGLFNQLAVGGTMLIRLVLSPVRDNENNALEITYQLTVAPVP